MNEKELITYTCVKCGTSFQISHKIELNRKRNAIPFLCKNCMTERRRDRARNYYNSLSDEAKQKFKDARNWYARATDEQKLAHSQKTKDQLAKRTSEEWQEINRKNSEGLKRHWRTVSSEGKEARVRNMRIGNKAYWDSLSKEERSIRARTWFDKLTDEEREIVRKRLSEQMTVYNASLSMEEKQKCAMNMQRWHENLSPDEKQKLYERTHQWIKDMSPEEFTNFRMTKGKWYNELSPEDKAAHAQRSIQQWKAMTPEERFERAEHQRKRWEELPIELKLEYTHRAISASANTNKGGNKLDIKFVTAFNNSEISSRYYLVGENGIADTITHSWDYGIYDRSTNQLVMLVDLDGAYYHADNCDYDGTHSREEYDEARSLSIPGDNNIKLAIIQELDFYRSFEKMIKNLIMDYDSYIESMFKEFRLIPFPEPSYRDHELLRSYRKLQTINTREGYDDLNINTRVGDRLIQHFHPSIYRANRKGNISPFDAWKDDKLLRKCIKNRVIYQNYLNPNKILQGFNISKIAPKVSVFSAGRASKLISMYLNEFNEIFDPFSGFSGRMLGSISLGKKYIGQDISIIHVNESNRMIEFLRNNRIELNASVIQKDVLTSSGEYECLFTCPPYEDKEQWLEVAVDTRTCDDWIDACLSRFKCNRYLFVVDYTERYIDYIVNEIYNSSYIASGSEYVIVINK